MVKQAKKTQLPRRKPRASVTRSLFPFLQGREKDVALIIVLSIGLIKVDQRSLSAGSPVSGNQHSLQQRNIGHMNAGSSC